MIRDIIAIRNNIDRIEKIIFRDKRMILNTLWISI